MKQCCTPKSSRGQGEDYREYLEKWKMSGRINHLDDCIQSLISIIDHVNVHETFPLLGVPNVDHLG